MLQMNPALFGVGMFVEALAAATLHLELVNSQIKLLDHGMCVDVTLCALGHDFGPFSSSYITPAELLSFEATVRSAGKWDFSHCCPLGQSF